MPARITAFSGDGQEVLEGGTAMFNCSLEGVPQPSVNWLFNGASLSSGDKYAIMSTATFSSLTISNVSPDDEGSYTCNATNDRGSDSMSGNLQVLSKFIPMGVASKSHDL